eukprot:m.10889 g.10889  ORF g.10889 m.10889 type:complete len:75 (+) comp5628_c0_seq2:671-895(+)
MLLVKQQPTPTVQRDSSGKQFEGMAGKSTQDPEQMPRNTISPTCGLTKTHGVHAPMTPEQRKRNTYQLGHTCAA